MILAHTVGGMVFRITCAQCGKLVDRVQAMRDNYSCSLSFRVHCHGEVDVCKIDDSFLAESSGRIIEGTAFNTKKLPQAPEK